MRHGMSEPQELKVGGYAAHMVELHGHYYSFIGVK